MKTDRELIVKSLKYFALTVLCMITGPYVLYQAFRNQEHSWYIPVLVFGIIIFFLAIALGFYSVRLLVFAFFGKKHQK